MFDLKDIITDVNKELSSSIYIDPLGQLVIWSRFGEEIFQNRINSISNDVRNFTLNLLHHGVIQKLRADRDFSIPTALEKKLGSIHQPRFAHTCLLYLENIAVYSLLTADPSMGVVTAGVLGSSNGRKLLDVADNNPELVFTTEPKGQILVRQLGLGVSGRYRTPFIELGYFDKNYHYSFNATANHRWIEFETELLKQNTELNECFEQALLHIKQLVAEAGNTNDSPSIAFNQVPDSLKRAYQSAFASSAHVGAATRDYWLNVTKLNTGAAGMLLHALRNHLHQNIDVQSIFVEALSQPGDSADRMKLEHVLHLEPFLTQLNLLFSIICSNKMITLADIEQEWRKFGYSNQTLRSAAEMLRGQSELLGVVHKTSKQRLHQLFDVASSKTVAEQAEKLIKYHEDIMKRRGQQPWVQLEKGKTKLHARMMKLPANDRAEQWSNSYYLHQFKHLLAGYFGSSDATD